MLGFGDFVLTSSAMTIPVYYTKADNSLVVYINEDLVKAYLDEETVTALLAYVAEMDYQTFYEMIEGSVLDGYVTEENFEGFKNMLLDLMVKLTSDDATYSVTASFVPYTAA